MAKEWVNWSGSVIFSPSRIEKPRHEEELAQLIRRANEDNQIVRVVGAGHSSVPLMATNDVLVSMEKFNTLISHDLEKQEAVIGAGLTVQEAGQALLKVGLAMHNTGDIDQQTVAGAIATGTHGTGRTLQNLATMLIGARLVNGSGEIVDYNIEDDPEIIPGLRASLGGLGILTAIRLKLLPKFELHRRELCAHIEDVLSHLDQLKEENRNFDFYWYPRSDEAKIRLLNPPGEGTQVLPYAMMDKGHTDWSANILPRKRILKFDEMEYALPIEAGPECFEEVRRCIKERWRKIVGWRVLYRTVAADDAYLSPAHGRGTVTISLHQNASLPFWEYFKDIEPVFRHYGGRPHWGKKHTLKAKELEPLYPEWKTYQALRRQFDPNNRLLNPYLRELLEG